MTTSIIQSNQIKSGPTDEKIYFFDDFLGSAFHGRIWTAGVEAGSSCSTEGLSGGQLRIRTDNATSALFNWNNIYSINSRNCEITFRIRREEETSITEIGLNSADGQIRFKASQDDTWDAETNDDSTTTTDTSIDANNVFRLHRIVVGTTDVKFYIDGILKATHTENIPDGPFEPYISQDGHDADQDTYIDYVEIVSERP